ncbi:Copper(I)-binding protein [Sinosporangium album]|uniref:Copper(I)-binding protein n=1 Tax=Sinosporangium album TaxID=504805 RepID=A0A1G8JZP7_9ACTN|nr:hypothetical protein [Sinosporangium album]SDI36682.1 Copper(I)-binding protein [Sinosporangium album]
MSPSRRLALAAAAFLAAAPALAGCAAGFDSIVEKPYSPTEAISLKTNRITIPQAFFLGPDSGGNLPAGGTTPLYLSLVNTAETADTLVGVTTEGLGTVKLANPIALPSNQGVFTGTPTPQLVVEGLSKSLHGGESFKVNLQFANAGSVALHVPVVTRSREFAAYPAVSGAVAPPAPKPTPSAATDAAGSGH